jgi:hypothetical protein
MLISDAIKIVMAVTKLEHIIFNGCSYSRLAAISVAITLRKTEQNLHRKKLNWLRRQQYLL